MKNLVPIILILLLAVGGWYVFTNYMGGSGSVSAPTDTPDIELPDAGEAAEGAERGAKKAADEIAGLPQVVWTTYVPLALFALACWWVWKDPKRRTAAFIVALVLLTLVVMGQIG